MTSVTNADTWSRMRRLLCLLLHHRPAVRVSGFVNDHAVAVTRCSRCGRRLG